jgi:hypothetical protein
MLLAKKQKSEKYKAFNDKKKVSPSYQIRSKVTILTVIGGI